MDTSRSGNWVAEALVWSGRPNPRWELAEAAAADLVAAWERLPERPGPPVMPAGLGYRGCTLHAPDGRTWWAAAGAVVLDRPHPDAGTSRDDPGRTFERRLLATAPPGVVPPGVVPPGGVPPGGVSAFG